MRIERLDETTRKNLLEDLLKRSPTVMERMKQVSARFWMK